MRRKTFLAILFLTLPGVRAAAAEDPAAFPPVTAEERALTSVPGEPNAPAVMLFKRGELLMAGYGRFIGSLASHLRVQARVKILTEAGKSNGELVIDHSDSLRLRSFSGRTVLPDGRIVPVPADARFERRTSKSSKTFVTTVAFPAVQVGAILDYQLEIVFSSPFVLEPWVFSDEMPVRHSEVVFKTAKGWTHRVWTRAPLGVKIQQEKKETPEGYDLRAWAENLPSIPRVPFGPAYADLASQILLLPASRGNSYGSVRLLDNWYTVSQSLGKIYDQVKERDGGVEAQARKTAAAGSPREKAAALYRFVRDEIRGEPGYGVLIDPDSSLKKVLAERHGSPTEKALLLQVMLKAVGVESRLVWAANRNRGTVDTTLPNPSWFDTVLVMVELDGKRAFLDPSDPALGFGQIRAGHEGTPALIPDANRPEGIVLSETPFDQSLRRAEVDLTLDDKGRLAGTGTLRLTGLHATERIRWQDDEAKTVQAWKDWLGERYKDFQIADVKTVELPDERRVTVTWSMAQREEEVLGDESTLAPSAPLGPAVQPFLQTVEERKMAVFFDYPDRDEVELRLRWPAGWRLDQRPRPESLDGPCGAFSSAVELDEGKRALVYRRRLDITRRTLDSKADYEAVRGLFGAAEKNDGQKLALVRR
jgi:transglutaminase-like putative cysteine protease